MELKEFIKESLVQISSGIKEANAALSDTNAIVNPAGIKAYSEDAQAYGRIDKNFKEKESLVELIEFDVSIQVASDTEKGGGAKLSIASVGFGADAKKKDSESTESRIRFKIPMVYPQQVQD